MKNGADIDGAEDSSYTTPAATMADSGSTFYCEVSNSAGKATSHTATLTVTSELVQPSIVSQPESVSVTELWSTLTIVVSVEVLCSASVMVTVTI